MDQGCTHIILIAEWGRRGRGGVWEMMQFNRVVHRFDLKQVVEIQCPPPNFRKSPSSFFLLIIHSNFYLPVQYCNPTINFIRLLNFSMKQEFKPFCCLMVITLSMSRAMERRASLSDGYLSWFSLYLN